MPRGAHGLCDRGTRVTSVSAYERLPRPPDSSHRHRHRPPDGGVSHRETGGSRRAGQEPDARVRPGARGSRGGDRTVIDRLRREGRARGTDHLCVHRRHGARPRVAPHRPRTTVGRRPVGHGTCARLRAEVPRPRVPREPVRPAGTAPPGTGLRDGAGHLPFVREQGDRTARRARAPPQRRRPGRGHLRSRRDRCLRPQRSRRVRRLQRGRRGRVHGIGHRHRGTVARITRHWWFADHPSGDPHARTRQGRHRGAEARVAAEAGDRRGAVRRRRHRARLRQ